MHYNGIFFIFEMISYKTRWKMCERYFDFKYKWSGWLPFAFIVITNLLNVPWCNDASSRSFNLASKVWIWNFWQILLFNIFSGCWYSEHWDESSNHMLSFNFLRKYLITDQQFPYWLFVIGWNYDYRYYWVRKFWSTAWIFLLLLIYELLLKYS